MVDMIAHHMLPLQLVERAAFQNFMAVVDPRYNVPSRRTITRHLHDGLQVRKDELKSELYSLVDDGLRIGTAHTTVNLWSTRTTESVIGVQFPRLAKLARTFLSVPASSGSVERLFSVSGAILIARRRHLTAQTVMSLLHHIEKDK